MRRAFTLTVAAVALATAMTAAQQNPYLGQWNMTGTGQDAANVYWLEVTQKDGALAGLFLNRTGHALPLAYVKVENGELVFQAGTAAAPTGPIYRARVEGGKLVGHHAITVGGGRGRGTDPNVPPPPPPTTRDVNWVGARPPAWPASNANGSHTYGAPVVLFDGTNMDAWGVQNVNRPLGWTVANGVMSNEAGANNLVSKQKFTDFKVEAEYRLTDKSNSGIYLRGRYELQLLDDFTDTTTEPFLKHMAIYGRKATDVAASKPSGEWQSMSAVLVANHVTVMLNGKRVHDNATIVGITGGALDNDELAPGPLMIQGDHTGVTFRKIVVTPITKAGR